MERFGDVGTLEDNVESFLSPDGGDGRDLYGTLKQSPTEQRKESSKGNFDYFALFVESWRSYLLSNKAVATFFDSGFTFGEVGCIRTRSSKVTCCHFSSDGKLLASAGHDKKVYTFMILISHVVINILIYRWDKYLFCL